MTNNGIKPELTTKQIILQEWYNKLYTCKKMKNDLKELKEITNSICSNLNCIYGKNNMERQLINFQRMNVPHDIIEQFSKFWELKSSYAQRLLEYSINMMEFAEQNLFEENKELTLELKK